MKSFSFKDENGKFYYGWWIVITGAIITGLVYSGIVSVTGVFMLPVTQDLGLSVAAYSFYLTIMSITGIITLAIVSKFLDEKRIKKIMITAGIIGVISFIGFASAKSLTMFYIFAVPQGFCFAAMTMTPCQLLVSNWFGEKAKGRAISLLLTGMTLVYIAELNILNLVIGKMGWRAGYIVLAVCVAIAVLIAAKLVVWSPEKKGLKRIGDVEDDEMEQLQASGTRGIAFSVAIRKPITWLVLISCSLAVIASSSILQHGIPTMVIAGFSAPQATAITSILSLIMVVTGPVGRMDLRSVASVHRCSRQRPLLCRLCCGTVPSQRFQECGHRVQRLLYLRCSQHQYHFPAFDELHVRRKGYAQAHRICQHVRWNRRSLWSCRAGSLVRTFRFLSDSMADHGGYFGSGSCDPWHQYH